MNTSWGPAFVTEPTAEPEVPEFDEEADERDEREAELAEATIGQVRPRDRAAHALRELEAAKARVERDAKRIENETRERLIAELLPVLDNLDRTIAAAKASGDAPAVLDGVLLVRRQLEGTLARFGVTRIEAAGELFDPTVHDAVSVVRVDDRRYDRRVIDELEPGYRSGGRLLRPAKVVVGRA